MAWASVSATSCPGPLPCRLSVRTIGYSCLGLPIGIVVHLSRGNSGTYAARELRSGVDALQYNLYVDLYVDPATLLVWGDGTLGSVHGRIPPDRVFPKGSTPGAGSQQRRVVGWGHCWPVPPVVEASVVSVAVVKWLLYG